jgi:hypothetical protein
MYEFVQEKDKNARTTYETVEVIIAIFLTLHVFACTWWTVILMFSDELDPRVVETESSFWEEYIKSVHWALGHFTTAPTDLLPNSPAERAFVCFSIAFGFFILGTLFTRLTEIYQRYSFERTPDEIMKAQLNDFILTQDISRSLAKRVRKFAEHKFSNMSHESVALQYLSPALIGEIRMEHSGEKLLKIDLFRSINKVSPACVKKIALCLQYNALEPGEVLFECGDIMDGCHIRVQGHFIHYSSSRQEIPLPGNNKHNGARRMSKGLLKPLQNAVRPEDAEEEDDHDDYFNLLALFCVEFPAKETLISSDFTVVPHARRERELNRSHHISRSFIKMRFTHHRNGGLSS